MAKLHKQEIDEGQPMTSDDAKRLGAFLSLGLVGTVSKMKPDAKPWSFDLVFFPVFSLNPLDRMCPIQVYIARLLAAPAAFEICLRLSELSRGKNRKRYVRKCHAPSCRKLFFTNRANAKGCERTEPGAVSRCKLEWDRYSRWLKKCKYDVATKWDDAELMSRFLEVD